MGKSVRPASAASEVSQAPAAEELPASPPEALEAPAEIPAAGNAGLKDSGASDDKQWHEQAELFDGAKDPQAAATPVAAAALPDNALVLARTPGTDFSDITGALTRRQKDPGPIRKMWFVFDSPGDIDKTRDVLRRVQEDNPGVEIVSYHKDKVLPMKAGKTADEAWVLDMSEESMRGLNERMTEERADFVLASNLDIYEAFRSLRDLGFARSIPFGIAGRRFVSVDMPRASLDPAKLSDPVRLPHRKWIYITSSQGPLPEAGATAGMRGARLSLAEVLHRADLGEEHNAMADEIGFFKSLLSALSMRLSRQADSKEMARKRKDAQALAAYLEQSEDDVVATDDPRAAELLAQMKREGYHLSLPVIWTGKEYPPDASAISLRSDPYLADAVRKAPRLNRLPDNFGAEGGVAVKDFEPIVRQAVDEAIPRDSSQAGKRYTVHFLLSAGNGAHKKGDANAYGHFGMAVEEENGEHLVWTVQYNDRRGASFTGGLGKGSQLTLAEYLYGLWYLPGATGQAYPLSETAVGPVLDFALRNIDEAGLQAMRQAAAFINAQHLTGKDSYDFLNQGGLTNCISLVTQILRAAGFPIFDSGTQAPGDKAVEFIRGFARRLLLNEFAPDQFGFVMFERPGYSASHYRIWNWALGSPFLNFTKPWNEMRLWEKVLAVLNHPLEFLRVPSIIDAFARMATHKVVVAQGGAKPELVFNPDSPISQLRSSAAQIAALRGARAPLLERLQKTEQAIVKLLGFEGWQVDPQKEFDRLSGRKQKALAKLLHIHDSLTRRISLSDIDEQMAARRVELYKLVIADPLGREARRLESLKEMHQEAISIRNQIETEGRLPTEAEIARLNGLNERAEKAMARARADILEELGPGAPRDLRVMLRRVTRETIKALHGISEGRDGGKKDDIFGKK